jgi:hypothetical protein
LQQALLRTSNQRGTSNSKIPVWLWILLRRTRSNTGRNVKSPH